jgi:hypothetical protein
MRGVWIAALAAACSGEPCENADPTVRIELSMDGDRARARSLELLLTVEGQRYRRVYELQDQLADGSTSLSVAIEPAPAGPFNLEIEAKAYDMAGASGAVLASRKISVGATADACNVVDVTMGSPGLPDGGPMKDGGTADAEPDGGTDGGPPDAEIPDAEEMDAAEMDAAEIDMGVPDTGVPDTGAPDAGRPDTGCRDDDQDGVCNADDNCPDVSNPMQEDTDGITATSIPFNPPFFVGLPIAVNGDDDLSEDLPIGFDLDFFGITVNTFRVSSNGFVAVPTTRDHGCCMGQAIPDPDTPNGVIAVAWTDLEVPIGGSVRFTNMGVMPNRRLGIAFEGLRHVNGPPGQILTAVVIVYEGSNRIEVHTNSQPMWPNVTRGVEDDMGTRAAYLPGEASATYSLSMDAVRYTTGLSPDGVGDACSNAHY